jgi:adenosylcobinamide-phosphate synthase
MAITALIPAIALWLDRQFGEPTRFHPLVVFGGCVTRVEVFFYGDTSLSSNSRQVRGFIAVLLLLFPPMAIVYFLVSLPYVTQCFSIVLLYLCLGMESLSQHASAVKAPLLSGDINKAREAVAMIVSRDVEVMDDVQVTRATIESVLENGNDAVFATLFWFFVFGAPGAVLLRLANTLDAMWGYRTERYNDFGCFAAKLDDALNWLPARLTTMTFALLGNTQTALRCWQTQAVFCSSPNGGPVMTAGAGSLGVLLGGPAMYHGVLCDKPVFGAGRSPHAVDIDRAVSLVKRGAWCWVALYAIVQMVIHA